MISLRTARKFRHRIEPLVNAKYPQIRRPQVWAGLNKMLRKVPIPLIGIGCPVLMAPIKEPVDDRGERI